MENTMDEKKGLDFYIKLCQEKDKEIERLRKALEFYADKEQYLTPPISIYGSKEGLGILIDNGIIAQQALKER